MPIVINAETNVATTTESSNFVGRAIDGISGAVVGSDNLTSKEAFAAFWSAAAGGFVAGSMVARKRAGSGKAAIWGFIA